MGFGRIQRTPRSDDYKPPLTYERRTLTSEKWTTFSDKLTVSHQ